MIEYVTEIIAGLDQQYVGIFLSLSLGLFIGIERERSGKMAGVRTFSLVSLSGGTLAIVGQEALMLLGMVLVLVFSILMGFKDISTEDDVGLSLTTSAALFITYLSGLLAGMGEPIIASVVAVITASLLISKDSLHDFAGGVTRQEFYSALELLALSVIVYPFIPSDNIGPMESIDLQLVWVLIIAVSGLGFVNYILVKKYEEKGFMATGFFGGLVNSTAVIGTIADRVSQNSSSTDVAVGAVLLANAAMAIRNTIIVGTFVPGSFVFVAVPLISVTVSGLLLSYYVSDFDSDFTASDLNSPFSLKNVLVFGGIFLMILVVSSLTTEYLGDSGFYITMFLAGLVSSGSSTTTAVTLASTGQISVEVSSVGVLVGTVASVMAKILLVNSVERSMLKPVALWSLLLIIIGGMFSVVSFFLL